MKIAGFALLVIFSTLLVTGGSLTILLSVDDTSLPVLLLWVGGLTTLMAVGIGASVTLVTSGRDPRSVDDRRYVVRWGIVLAVATILAVVVLGVGAAIAGVSAPLAVGVIGAGLFFVILSAIGGEYLRRRDERLRPSLPPAAPLGEAFFRRRVRTAVWWFLGVLLAGVVGATVATVVTGETDALPVLLSGALLFASIGAMMVCLSVVVRLSAVSRELLGKNPARSKRVGRLIRGKDAVASAEDRELAVRYAPTARATIAWTAAQTILLYVGLITTNAVRIVGDDGTVDVFLLVLVLALVTIGATLFPFMLLERRRIGRFIASHGEPSASPVEQTEQSEQTGRSEHIEQIEPPAQSPR